MMNYLFVVVVDGIEVRRTASELSNETFVRDRDMVSIMSELGLGKYIITDHKIIDSGDSQTRVIKFKRFTLSNKIHEIKIYNIRLNNELVVVA